MTLPQRLHIPVLMYHSLSDGSYPDSSYLKYTISSSNLENHVKALSDDGFHFVTFEDLRRHFAKGTALPDKPCILSFDDGHRSSLDIARILKEHNASATLFVTMDYCRNRNDFLAEEEIKQLYEQGFDIGTHGVTHRSLAHLPIPEMQSEIRDSKDWLETLLGDNVYSMSLPAGQGNAGVYDFAFSCGYQLIGNSCEKQNHIRSIPAVLNRFVILSSYSPKLASKIANGSLPYQVKRKIRSLALSIPKRLLRPYNKTR